MITYLIIVVLLAAIALLVFALISQTKKANKKSEEEDSLLADYQKRVDELQKVLEDYRALEKNFDNIGQGYEQALELYDKIQEDSQKLEERNKLLEGQTGELLRTKTEAEELIAKTNICLQQIAESLEREAKSPQVNTIRVLTQVANLQNLADMNNRTPISFNDNVEAIVIAQLAADKAEVKSADYLKFEIKAADDAANAMIITNKQKAVDVLAQLLANALKFTMDGGVMLKIEVDPEATSVRFIVEDTGSGIPKEEADHVFKPFVKLNSYFDGFGIGLTAARDNARRLGGDITLDTDYAAGARFVFKLPM